MSVVRRRVVVHGRVQGVYFRDTARRRALARGVSGLARNRPDGTVEAIFEGPPEAVEALVGFCRVGPPDALVTRVDVTEEEPRGVRGFGIE